MRGRRWLWCLCGLMLLAGSVGRASADGRVTAVDKSEVAAPTVASSPSYRTHIQAHGSITVWAAATTPAADAAIYAYDATTATTLTLSADTGHKSAPAISDGLIVWEDARNTCHSCAHDIYGYDLATRREFSIAPGAPNVDRSVPAVSGRRVVWLEQQADSLAIRGVDLATGGAFTIARADSAAEFFGAPQIDGTTVVYSHHRRLPQSAATPKATFAPSELYVQTIGGTPLLIATTPALDVHYVVAGGRVLWSGGGQGGVRAYDLATGQTQLLSDGLADQVALDGGLAAWYETNASAPGIYGYDFAQHRSFLIEAAPAADSPRPLLALVGRTLYQYAANSMRAATIGTTFHNEDIRRANTSATLAKPAAISKGLHAANTQLGWSANNKLKTAGIDALADANGNPYVNSILVLNSDLHDSTGVARTDKARGPKVADAMRNFVKNHDVQVMVRLWPTHQPRKVGSKGQINPRGNPQTIADAYVALAKSYDWIADVQTDNEPNLEWHACGGCGWQTWDGHKSQTYAYTNPFDPRLFDAINQYYVDAWNAIDHATQKNPNKTVRARLAVMRRWTPPLSEYWGTRLSDGSAAYDHLKPMLDTYTNFDYHLYPDATYHATNGGLSNPVWNESFANAASDYVRQNISNGTYKTTITEFGWGFILPPNCQNPPHTQNDVWPAACAADGQDHRFETDIAYIRANELHGAAAADVWLVQNVGLDYYANGYERDPATKKLVRKRWLANYITQP